jgi:hypothetical protein
MHLRLDLAHGEAINQLNTSAPSVRKWRILMVDDDR